MSRQRIYECYMDLGWTCWDKKDFDGAIDVYNKAIELDPDNPDAYQRRGQIYRQKAQAVGSDTDEGRQCYDKSDADLKKAIELYEADL